MRSCAAEVVRGITDAIHYYFGPFHDVAGSGRVVRAMKHGPVLEAS